MRKNLTAGKSGRSMDAFENSKASKTCAFLHLAQHPSKTRVTRIIRFAFNVAMSAHTLLANSATPQTRRLAFTFAFVRFSQVV